MVVADRRVMEMAEVFILTVSRLRKFFQDMGFEQKPIDESAEIVMLILLMADLLWCVKESDLLRAGCRSLFILIPILTIAIEFSQFLWDTYRKRLNAIRRCSLVASRSATRLRNAASRE